ncbi:MAG: dTMP kinase [Gammaproteobacteria bacterium]|nr:dTMP kinase [Gammaproteobacteria bacterium]
MFITLEGIDGSGKTTQIATLAKRLRAQGHDVVLTREPGGTAVGERLRTVLLESADMQPRTELLLMFAARLENLAQIVLPALALGRIVLCDRYLDATYAYQGYGRRLPLPLIDELVRSLAVPQPDLTLLLDLPPETALARRCDRRIDRIEAADPAFFKRVRQGYLARAEAAPERIVVVDGARAFHYVEEALIHAVLARL